LSHSAAILQLRGLTRTIETNGRPKRIVDSVSYDFQQGKIYSILGPSGAGKSSLLRLLNRLDEPTAGEVIFDGQDHRSINPCSLRRRIGYLFQVPYMFSGTVADNIRYASPDLTEEDLLALAQSVRLEPDMLGQSVENLSIGEQQRIALARLLATKPDVALLDEPTASLDPSRTRTIERLIVDMVERRCVTAIMVSHRPQQALRMGGQGLLLFEGRLVETAPTRELVESPKSELGRRYQRKELT